MLKPSCYKCCTKSNLSDTKGILFRGLTNLIATEHFGKYDSSDKNLTVWWDMHFTGLDGLLNDNAAKNKARQIWKESRMSS